ncbi:hypothetical protein [Ancylomarina sp.]|uniref:hypothetical protein n=1 Tax=Ancylomarina sp. TaxID=1970196 RepID=UPI003568C8ED
MPISDQEGYEKGHFRRVYDHIIKPACENAGFEPIRADDEVKTNYIVLDIITKILESDIVICDLSAKNPNVLYELGLRQAFNKKALLIKDLKTDRIFDIQGLRTIDYNESLRVDSVQKDIVSVSKSLKETHEAKDEEVNSIIQLLAIKPATLSESVNLSNETSVILRAIKEIQNRITSIERNGNHHDDIPLNEQFLIKSKIFTINNTIWHGDKQLGILKDVQPDKLILKTNNNEVISISKDADFFDELVSDDLPF